jgi:hypothetical protein
VPRGHPKGLRLNCRHCDMVREYYWERDRTIREKEVAGGDEFAYVWIFKDWLINYEWEVESL